MSLDAVAIDIYRRSINGEGGIRDLALAENCNPNSIATRISELRKEGRLQLDGEDLQSLDDVATPRLDGAIVQKPKRGRPKKRRTGLNGHKPIPDSVIAGPAMHGAASGDARKSTNGTLLLQEAADELASKLHSCGRMLADSLAPMDAWRLGSAIGRIGLMLRDIQRMDD